VSEWAYLLDIFVYWLLMLGLLATVAECAIVSGWPRVERVARDAFFGVFGIFVLFCVAVGWLLVKINFL
jgi:hypothetical protein